MNVPLQPVLLIFTAVSFVYFGLGCLLSPSLRAEFDRYGLAAFRTMTGALQLMGAAGLLAGLWLRPLGFLAAVGLTVLMMLGVGVRRRVGDSWPKQLPAALYAALSGIAALSLIGPA